MNTTILNTTANGNYYVSFAYAIRYAQTDNLVTPLNLVITADGKTIFDVENIDDTSG